MKLTPLSEVADLDDGQIVSAVAGQLKYVNKYSEGEGDHGKWALQPIVLSDGQNEVRVLLKNRPQLPASAKGEDVLIQSVKTEKHGLQGIKVKLDNYQGKERKELVVTASAKFQSQDGRSENGDDYPPQSPAKQLPLKPAVNVDAARHHLMRAANLYLKCVDAAKYIDKTGFNINMSTEHFQACVATLFINADRAGLVAAMPDKPLAKTEPVTVVDANDPPDVVPGGEPPDADPEW